MYILEDTTYISTYICMRSVSGVVSAVWRSEFSPGQGPTLAADERKNKNCVMLNC